MKKVNLFLLLMLGLICSVANTGCSKDEPSKTSTEDIMEFISGRVFQYRDISADEEYGTANDYNHRISFTATSDNGGIFNHECFWKDISIDGVEKGTVYDEGSFRVTDGKIYISIYRGDTWYIEYFTVKGNTLVGDNGDVYNPVGGSNVDNSGSSSDNSGSVSSHRHPLDYYQTQYNTVISQLISEFMSFETAKAMGDTNGARKISQNIKNLQNSAKQIRQEAKEDGWTIEKDPYETKSAYV